MSFESGHTSMEAGRLPRSRAAIWKHERHGKGSNGQGIYEIGE